MSEEFHLSLEAFSSSTASFIEVPSRARARHRMLVVFPVPGGPRQSAGQKDRHLTYKHFMVRILIKRCIFISS